MESGEAPSTGPVTRNVLPPTTNDPIPSRIGTVQARSAGCERTRPATMAIIIRPATLPSSQIRSGSGSHVGDQTPSRE